MGSTLRPLKLGDAPSERLKRYRVANGGRAQLRHLVDRAVKGAAENLAGIAFTLKHRAPRDLEAIERALLVQLADVENALAHVRHMIAHRDMPVSANEMARHDVELQSILGGKP